MTLNSNNFTRNQAKIKGGAIHFEKNLPSSSFRFENIFMNNSAFYGPDFSSYPIRIRGQNIQKQYKIIPGIEMTNAIEFDLIDHYDQIVYISYNTYYFLFFKILVKYQII